MSRFRFTLAAMAPTLAAVIPAGIAGAEPPPAPAVHPHEIPAPPLADRIYGLSTLWSEAKFSFAFFHQVPDLDWDAAYRDALERVADTETMYGYYRELQAFIAQLDDGHTDVTMPREVRPDAPPMWLRFVDGRFIVDSIDIALVDRIPIGSEIVAVRGIPAAEYAAKEVEPYVAQSAPHARNLLMAIRLLDAPRGEMVPFTVVTPEGVRRDVSVASGRWADGVEYTPAFPSREVAVTWPAEGIAMVNLTTFADDTVPSKFAELVPELETARAVIIDLRRNGGGATGIGKSVLSHFVDRDLVGSHWSTREHRASHRVWGAYGTESYAAYGQLDAWTEPEPMSPLQCREPGSLVGKPLVVLTSTFTASAAEDFVLYADSLESVTRIGRPTMGTTGQPLPITLPGGGSARICTKRDTWPDGTDFVGVGVEPDILVPMTVADIRSGHDRVLEVAIDHLGRQLTDSAQR